MCAARQDPHLSSGAPTRLRVRDQADMGWKTDRITRANQNTDALALPATAWQAA